MSPYTLSASTSLVLLAAVLTAASAWPQGSQVFRDCPDCPEMVVVPAGGFRMGSPTGEAGRQPNEGPVRPVTLRSFAISRYEVTVGEFTLFARETGHAWPGSCLLTFVQDTRHPAVCISWDDAKAYVAWLARKTGRDYRLPSEAEWEYAARGGTETPYHFGASITAELANYDGKGSYALGRTTGIFRAATTPVGSFPANAFGLHDMHGNVWEWTEDCYNPGYAGAPGDGSAWLSGNCGYRVMRSGTWNLGPAQMRSAYRVRGGVEQRSIFNGLRVVRSAP